MCAGAGFLLAVLWFDLMFDVQVLRHRIGDEPDETLASIAAYYRRVTTAARPMNRLVMTAMLGNQSLTGVFLGAEIGNARARAMVGQHINDVAAGRLQVVVDRTYPLADAAAAHAYIESRQAFGRVLLIP